MDEGAFLYILRCSDGSFYIGTTRTTLEIRIAQHNAGTLGGYTATRRPVTLVFSQWLDRITDAIENERKLKKWSGAKKEAFVREISRRSGSSRSAGHRTLPGQSRQRTDNSLELSDQPASHGACSAPMKALKLKRRWSFC
jgi:putative endonuclease